MDNRIDRFLGLAGYKKISSDGINSNPRLFDRFRTPAFVDQTLDISSWFRPSKALNPIEFFDPKYLSITVPIPLMSSFS